MKQLLLSLCLVLFSFAASVARGQAREIRIPLDHASLNIHALNAALCDELHLPHCPAGGQVALNGPEGAEFLIAVNACLWRGSCLEQTSASAVTLKFERSPSVSKMEAIRRLSRIYAAEQEPHATAAQARSWGLLIPQAIDPSRPLAVLVHGLDADRSDCMPIGQLLQAAGQQVAYFSYPGDQPIDDSAASLGRAISTLRKSYPHLTIDIIAHSMGGLVARQFVEGPDYAGGVSRMILVAPPNHGSSWARLRAILSIEENLHLRHDNPDWHWTWLVTEGLGEAGTDLLPGSEFLDQLNSRPRRAGVRYTIIAGNQSGLHHAEGNCLKHVANWIPVRSRRWWGVRNCYSRLQRTAEHLHVETGKADGPVALSSAKLSGVNDFVVLPADHISLYLPVDGGPPAAWPVIRDRILSDRR